MNHIDRAIFHAGRGPVGKLAEPPVGFLVCFAVKEEAKYFMPLPGGRHGPVQTWITGIGRRNAEESIRRAVDLVKPGRVLTCGFAGGLNPGLKCGQVVYDCDLDVGLAGNLEEAGALAGRFHCASRVATTATEKGAMWKSTGADAVEMESSVIRTICREHGIPSATIRVISDSAQQDLPLDFNALMTGDERVDYFKLLRSVLASPAKIPRLIELQRQTVTAAQRLAQVLVELLRRNCR